MDWLRGRRPAPTESEAVDGPHVLDEDEGSAIDHDAGETPDVQPAQGVRTVRKRLRHDAGASTVAGERAIPSVNRERSVQSRVSNALAVGAMLLVGAGFLFWYYSTQFAKQHEAQEAAKKAAEARAAGEMKLPPLGRIDPPKPDMGPSTPASLIVGDVLGAAPPPPQGMPPVMSGGTSGAPPQKTPEQLALERKLSQPVLLRAQFSGAPAGASAPAHAPPGAPSNLANLFGLAGTGSDPSVPGGLGAMLRPTPTPAVSAQVVPNRRFLLPKGAFIDCTLETAIDSTFDGMVTCIGANDIYSADGKVVLLERGTKYVGEKKGEVKQGQGRVFVLWGEARTPTGVVVNLASPGTDELGRAGLPGYVDTHFWDRFGAAILISVIDGGLQALAARQQSGGGGTAVVLNPQGSRDVMTEVLRGTIAIPPTVIKNQGERIQVFVARDVDFRAVYALRTEAGSQ
jgi:type IV secretion system protein VirB10